MGFRVEVGGGGGPLSSRDAASGPRTAKYPRFGFRNQVQGVGFRVSVFRVYLFRL